MKFSDAFVGKRFFVGLGKPEILGRGEKEVRGSAYVEGPSITGDPQLFSAQAISSGEAGPEYEVGVTMASQNHNDEYLTGVEKEPFYAFFVRQYARIASFLKTDKLLCVEKIKSKIIYAETIMAKTKNFIIPHPSKKNKNLVYACLEGPENAVYVRGVLKNSDTIALPSVWKKLVDKKSITVSLTPIGAHQDLIVKGIQNNQVVIQSRAGIPIECYYHVFAERKDVPKLITEVDK